MSYRSLQWLDVCGIPRWKQRLSDGSAAHQPQIYRLSALSSQQPVGYVLLAVRQMDAREQHHSMQLLDNMLRALQVKRSEQPLAMDQWQWQGMQWVLVMGEDLMETLGVATCDGDGPLSHSASGCEVFLAPHPLDLWQNPELKKPLWQRLRHLAA